MDHKFCPYCMAPVEDGKPCGACGLTQGSYTPSPHHLPPGTVLKDRYLVGRVLGEGGFGITYIGCDLQLELKVAIKEYFPTDKASRVSQASLDVSSYTGAAGVNYDKGMKKFLQEARTIARMDKQPVIVNVRDFFEVNHTAYIVMEYVEGTTFKELVEQRGGRIPAGELLYLIEPLFFALKEMHGNGLIHRDISPENLMLEKGEVRLLDFGCARESADGGNTLTIALKHGYAPVEQYQSKGQGPWTDVYALSATIYYCLTGRKPPQAMDRLVEDELIPPRKLGVDLTQRQENALLHGMGVAPKRRFQSMEEFHTALYEGFVPGVVEENAGGQQPAPTTTVTAGGGHANSEAGGEHTVEADATQEAPAPAFNPAAWLKQNKLLAGGIAAALALVILLAAVLPRLLGPSSLDDPDPSQSVEGTPGPEDTEPPAQSKPPVPAHLAFERNQTDEDNVAVLLALLADDSVDTVTVPAHVWFDVTEPITLTKRLRITADAGITFNNSITVAEGGSLEIAGDANFSALLRTMDGGAVTVEEGANLWCCNVWLERKEDLTAAPGSNVNYWGENSVDPNPHDMSHRLTLDEEALFADAVHVSSEEEFSQNLRGTKPIVIDGEVTLTQPRECYVPILVPESSTLNAPCDENSGDCTLDVQGKAVVNHGTIRGRVSLFGSWDDINRIPALVNHGRFEGCLNTYDGPSTVINLGEFALSTTIAGAPNMDAANLANLGSLTLDSLMEMAGNWSVNAGAVSVARGGELTLHNNANWDSYGQFTIDNGGQMHNEAQFTQHGGRLTVSDGGELQNHGTLRAEGPSALTARTGAVLVNNGVILEDGGISLGSSPIQGQGRVLSLRYDSDQTRHVSSESQLRSALADDRCTLVVWDGHNPEDKIDLNGGPIRLTKGLILRGNPETRPEFHSGGITLSGEDAFLITDNADFHSNEMIVDGGTVLLGGETLGLGENIVVEGGGLLCLEGGADMPNPGRLTLRGGGTFIIKGNIEFGQTDIAVEEGAALRVFGSLGLSSCKVTSAGRIDVPFGNLYQEDGGSIANHGQMELFGWSDSVNLGDVTNHGQIIIGGRQRLSGTLVNEEDGTITLDWEDNTLVVSGNGRLDNRGTIRGARGTYIETVDGGSFTGNSVVYE